MRIYRNIPSNSSKRQYRDVCERETAIMAQPPGPSACDFLKYETAGPVEAGLDRHVSNLRCLLREAHTTGRLAVVPPPSLSSRYNFDVWSDPKWETFFDLRDSRLVDAAGNQHPLPVAPRGLLAAARVHVVRPGEPVPAASGGRGTLAIRQTRNDAFERDVPLDLSAVEIRLHSSTRVKELARDVVERIEALDGGRFVAVHVRRGDRLAQYPGRLTEPAHIRECLKRWDVPDGSVLFVMSDERAADFFRPLQEHYRLFRYVDFPRLRSLVFSDDAVPDNHLLYCVESEVAKSARLRLATTPNVRPTQLPSQGPQGFLVGKTDWKPPHGVRGLSTLSRRSRQIRGALTHPAVAKEIAAALAQGRMKTARHMADTIFRRPNLCSEKLGLPKIPLCLDCQSQGGIAESQDCAAPCRPRPRNLP